MSLNEVNVFLQLLHLHLQLLLQALLRACIRDDRQGLVLVVQLLPVPLEPLGPQHLLKKNEPHKYAIRSRNLKEMRLV